MGFGAARLAALLLIALAIGASAQTTSVRLKADTTATTPGGTGAPRHAVAQLATHSTRGVVETVDAARLVITDPRHTRQTTFVLNAQTERQGRLAAGVNVTVRYRTEKGANVATAVVVEPAKAKPRNSTAADLRVGRSRGCGRPWERRADASELHARRTGGVADALGRSCEQYV